MSGFVFLPVNKTRIVELHWHEWDLSTDHPREFPKSGEPEDYILERHPNPRVAHEFIRRSARPESGQIARADREVQALIVAWRIPP